MSDIRTLLRLLSIPGIGQAKIRALAQYFPLLSDVFRATPNDLVRVPGIDRTLALRLCYRVHDEQFADEQLQRAERAGVKLISLFDEDYPPLLKAIYDPPVLLYYKGSLTVLHQPTIALVGTRHPTPYGQSVTEQFARELVQRNFCIVSGLARGIDTIAHTATLKAGGNTCAVIGSGIDVPYPPENSKLLSQISEHGVVLSEFPMGTKPDAPNFPRRNRIISGVSTAVVVLESDTDGGAMITASFANDQNREVFALPGSVREKKSAGPHTLIRENRAKLVTSVNDILTELNVQLALPLSIEKPQLPPLTQTEQKLFSILTTVPQHIDSLSEQTGLSPSDALVTLLSLEFKNLVRQLPGKYFVRME